MVSHPQVPRIERLNVRNYRALRHLEMDQLTPLTVLLGPNGSGKSTIFDVFAFLSECFTDGLRRAWDRRGRFRELRSRGVDGPIVIELKYREVPRSTRSHPGRRLITYHLEVGEEERGPFVAREWLAWQPGTRGAPFRFLDFEKGEGKVVEGDAPEESANRINEKLESPEVFAVNTLGQLSRHPRVVSLRRFITGWYLSYLSADSARGVPVAGPQERLSKSGDNLPNVVQYLKEQHPKRLETILRILRARVPRLENVATKILDDGRLLLRFKDAPFDEPVLARFASDGTLKMLAYLAVLHDADPPPLVGIEEPENYLHPKLLYGLAEECRAASARTQLLVTTHSPYFVNGLEARELRVLRRNDQGFTEARRVEDLQLVPSLTAKGALLGDLWMEGYFDDQVQYVS